jgi:diguanylate cyclase (GGDEF)-like protein
MDTFNIFHLIILLSAGMILIVVYNIGKSMGIRKSEEKLKKESKHLVPSREAAYYEEKINALNLDIFKLNGINERYLNFTEHLSDIAKHLYSSLSSKEIAAIIISLVKDIMNTDTIEMFMLDKQDNVLKIVNQLIQTKDQQATYAIGEGLIGSAAQDGIIKIKGLTYKTDSVMHGKDESKFWMVSPIKFEKNIIGVLGIGEVKNPTGNERHLIKIICDIAGVTLANQTYLKEWKHGSIKDPLTGLYNRRYFSHMSMVFVEKAVLAKLPVTICMFDIDHFKNYNDTNGHQAGDRLLTELSGLLIKSSRKSSVIARYGGEEFIVMLSDISKKDAFVYAERLRKEIESHPFFHREKQPLGCISISGGVACFPQDSGSIDNVINLADKALYKAKADGRNRIIEYLHSSNGSLK